VLTGKRFELSKGALAIEIGSERSCVTIPAGDILAVVSGPDGEGDHRLIIVAWKSRLFAMFAIDLKAYGTEIKDQGASA
jgi:hypothetical protein